MHHPINAVVIDNDPQFRFSLNEHFTHSFPQVNLLASTDLGFNAEKMLQEYCPDLLLIDIGRPDMGGVELIKKYGHRPPFEVVWVDKPGEEQRPNITWNSLDYLQKPICNHKLFRIVKHYESKKQIKDLSNKVESLTSLINSYFNPNISLPTYTGFTMVNFNEIEYCEAESNYTLVRMIDGRKILVTRTLKEIENSLKLYLFSRVHKSFLINLNYLDHYKKGEGGFAVMKSNKEIPISRYKKDGFLKNCKRFKN